MTLPFGNSYRLVTCLTPGATHYRARLKLAFNSVSVSSVSVGSQTVQRLTNERKGSDSSSRRASRSLFNGLFFQKRSKGDGGYCSTGHFDLSNHKRRKAVSQSTGNYYTSSLDSL